MSALDDLLLKRAKDVNAIEGCILGMRGRMHHRYIEQAAAELAQMSKELAALQPTGGESAK